MLGIVILPDNIRRSLFRYNDGPGRILDELPEKLLLRVTRVLTIMTKNGFVKIEYYDDKRFIISGNNGRHYDAHKAWNNFSGEFLLEFIGVISDFDWFLGSHIMEEEPGKLDGKIICNECRTEQLMNLGNKCGDPGCPSHAKWKRVDDNYVPPDVFKRIQMGIPKTGNLAIPEDAANKWAQNG